MTVDDSTTNKHVTPQGLTFDQAVAQVVNAPPTPEQQAKKEASKARRVKRKRRKQAEATKQ